MFLCGYLDRECNGGKGVFIGFYVNKQNVGSNMVMWTKKMLQYPKTIDFFLKNFGSNI